LTVDVYGASGVSSAGRVGVGGNDAVGDGFDRPAFRAGEEMPRAGPDRNWRIAGVGFPGKAIEDDRGTGRPTAKQAKGGARQPPDD
jgi:hypothetical protein